MYEAIYQTLESLGYTHPLHPILTHLTIGLTMGAFIFALGGKASKGESMIKCARYCVALALIALIPTALLGYMDWQHFYGGAWLFPFKAKLILAGLLLVLLVVTGMLAERAERQRSAPVFAYLLCFLCVVGLGYFGGELVFGGKQTPPVPASPAAGPETETEESADLASRGAGIFSGNCAMCHATDTTEEGIGPGLKGLFSRDTLPVSGRPLSEAAVRKQIRDPYQNMPPFPNLTEPQVEALIAYLKTL